MEPVRKAIELLRWHNATPRRYSVYVLVKDIPDALERVRFLKGLDVGPFAQPYRDLKNNTEPTQEQRGFRPVGKSKGGFQLNHMGEL